MYFKADTKDCEIEIIDEKLIEGSLFLGMEQSFHILDYNTKKVLPKKKSKGVARHINRGIWDSLLVGETPGWWKDHLWAWLREESFTPYQYELQIPSPYMFKNFEGLYEVLGIVSKRMHEEAENSGVLISTVPIADDDKILLTDNHITISHLDIPIIDAYNNLRAHVPELLVRSANSPITHQGKSERNLLIDDLYLNPHVGPRIKSISEYKRYNDKQRPDYDKIVRFIEKFSQTTRENLRKAIKDPKSYGSKIPLEVAMKAGRLLLSLPQFTYQSHYAAPKSLDVCIKGEKDDPRIELVIPDGSTCAHDMIFNAVKTMIAAYSPTQSKLPTILEMYLLQGKKTYSSITGEIYQETNDEELLGVWRRLKKIDRQELLKDPLALFLFFRDKELLFKVNVQELYCSKLDEWKVPLQIKEKIRGLTGGESPANVYERTDEPEYKAFDNLSENSSWIRS